VKRSTRAATPQKPRRRRVDSQVDEYMGPKGEPSPAMVRALLAKNGHTVNSAAAALGLSLRTMQRYVTDGPGWRRPSRVALAALDRLSPPLTQWVRRLVRARASAANLVTGKSGGKAHERIDRKRRSVDRVENLAPAVPSAVASDAGDTLT